MAQGFDPAAATKAYLAFLTPAQHARATAYTHGGYWILLWTALVSVLAAWIVLKSGVLVRVRDGVQTTRPRPWLAVLAVAAVDTVFEALLNLPWNAYAGWAREKAYGLTSRPFGGWLGEQALGLVVSLVIALIMFSGLYWIIRRAPRSWWAWSAVGFVVGFIALSAVQPLVIEPLFNTFKPAPPGPMRDEIVAMARQVDVPSDRIFIYNGSKQSNRYSANVSGLFGTARIAMSDVMFKKDADLAEVRAVVGHEMGHYVLHHIFRQAAEFGLVALLGFFLIDRLFAPTARLLGVRGIGGVSDPAGLPIIGILITVFMLLMTPVTNSIIRVAESEADRFSLERFNEPDGLAKALVKTIEYRADSPGRLEEIIFYSHPSVGRRVRRAMDWKAAHPKPPPAPSPAASGA